MKTKLEGDTLTMYLTGRIDANNAGVLEAQFTEKLMKYLNATPILDAEGLEYISSAGLRVLLKIRKAFGKDIEIVNVSNEVYGIFEVTGFTELLNVRKKLREISVEGLEVIGGGSFSTVYRLDPETILKVYDKKPVTLAEVEHSGCHHVRFSFTAYLRRYRLTQ